jgi:hypothetical protein
MNLAILWYVHISPRPSDLSATMMRVLFGSVGSHIRVVSKYLHEMNITEHLSYRHNNQDDIDCRERMMRIKILFLWKRISLVLCANNSCFTDRLNFIRKRDETELNTFHSTHETTTSRLLSHKIRYKSCYVYHTIAQLATMSPPPTIGQLCVHILGWQMQKIDD